jgi:diguanylate cyclase (GGDEF)-like protein/PAS domain S-box-containing protein
MKNKRTHKSDAASNISFKSYFDTTPIASVITSLEDGRIALANNAFSKLIGLPKEDLIGKSANELSLWSGPIEHEEMIYLLNECGSLYNYSMQVKDSSGFIHLCLLFIEYISLNKRKHLLIQAVDITESSSTVIEKLIEPENKVLNLLRSAIDEVPLGITLADLSGKIVLSNTGEANIHGYTKGELLGSDVSVFTGDERPKSPHKIFNWKPWSREVLSTRKDGSKVYIELTSNTIKDDSGNPIGIVSISKDISDKKKLLDRVEVFERAISSSINAIAIYDKQGRFISLNKAFMSLWGYNDEPDAKGLNAMEFWKKHKLPNSVIAALQRDSDWSGEFSAIKTDGTEISVQLTSSVVTDKEYVEEFTIIICLDVTLEKLREEELSLTRERLSIAMDSARIGYWDWDLSNDTVYFSKRWCEMLGYTSTEIVPNISTWKNMIHPDDIKGVLAVLEEHISGGTPYYNTEHRLRTKSGLWIWVLDAGKIVKYDEHGNPLRVAGIHMDINDRKALELKMNYLASTDPMTDIPNRSTGLTFLEKQMQLSKRLGLPLCIIYADIDNLKKVNDNLGHETGDLLIKTAASIMKSALREADMISRLGGDEFLIICPNCNIIQANVIIERIERNTATYNNTQTTLNVSLSYGIVEFDVNKYMTADEFLSKADSAMYSHKQHKQSRNT